MKAKFAIVKKDTGCIVGHAHSLGHARKIARRDYFWPIINGVELLEIVNQVTGQVFSVEGGVVNEYANDG